MVGKTERDTVLGQVRRCMMVNVLQGFKPKVK